MRDWQCIVCYKADDQYQSINQPFHQLYWPLQALLSHSSPFLQWQQTSFCRALFCTFLDVLLLLGGCCWCNAIATHHQHTHNGAFAKLEGAIFIGWEHVALKSALVGMKFPFLKCCLPFYFVQTAPACHPTNGSSLPTRITGTSAAWLLRLLIMYCRMSVTGRFVTHERVTKTRENVKVDNKLFVLLS